MNCSWEFIRNQVKEFRFSLQTIYPLQAFAIVKDFVSDSSNNLYFLSDHLALANEINPNRQLQLYKISFDLELCSKQLSNQDEMTTEEYLSACSQIPVLKLEPLFREYSQGDFGTRFRVQGMSSFAIKDSIIMFTSKNSIYISKAEQIPTLIPYKSNCSANGFFERVDPKLGGNQNNMIAFIRERDIWVTDFLGNERQLTFSSDNLQDPTLNCGGVEYMMQEEFHRSTGYYWAPANSNGLTERIVYLETSENQVELLWISKQETVLETNISANKRDPIRYPYAGKTNAVSKIKIIEFDSTQIVHKHLTHDLESQFPWMEYIVRFGWLPDGKSIWAQILSRDQKKTALIKLSLSQFSFPCTETTEVLWEETNNAWINISDVYYFMNNCNSEKTIFVWSSEKTNGFRHLYYVEKEKNNSPVIVQLTRGEWCCVDKPIYVDELRHLIYFSANTDTPLECHFYVVSFVNPHQGIKRLTKLGFSHTVTMNMPDCFVDCFSSLHTPKVMLLQYIHHGCNFSTGLILPYCQLAPERYSDSLLSKQEKPENENKKSVSQSYLHHGDIFDFVTSDGVKLYGCLYKPRFYKAGCSYPTLLHIYGGPKCQMVMNDFKFPRLIRYLMSAYFGFAVVIIDSRGSCDRGLDFESHIQKRLGTVELKDQIEGLQYLQSTKFSAEKTEEGKCVSVIDLKKLAITGWSYGGYLSLMALAQYPEIFKMAIAGAPVTQWELYDAAYTERYMGMPSENQKAYAQSSVLRYIEGFPDNGYRLLIAHGLIDENVHFRNTEVLVAELVKHNKHHYLQVYPTEKHGLRRASVNEHFETLMFYWLINYL